jgi:hypothetical protein
VGACACACQVRKQTIHRENCTVLSWNTVHKYISDNFFVKQRTHFLFKLRTLSDAAQRMYSMPVARHGRPRRSVRSPRHVAPVLLVVHWLRRAIKRCMSNTGNKCRIPAASYEVLCAHLRTLSYLSYVTGFSGEHTLAPTREHFAVLSMTTCGSMVTRRKVQ